MARYFFIAICFFICVSGCRKDAVAMSADYEGNWCNTDPDRGALIHIDRNKDKSFLRGADYGLEPEYGTATINGREMLRIGHQKFHIDAAPSYDAQGNYCMVLDGEVFYSAFIPTQLSCYPQTTTDILLQWGSGSHLIRPTSLTIQYRKDTDPDWTSIETMENGNHLLNSLEYGKHYEWRMKATYGLHETRFTTVQLFNTY